MLPLFVNAFFWFFVLLKIRYRKFTMLYVIMMVYAIMALGTLFLYNSSYYDLYFEKNIEIFPFLYLNGMILLSVFPLFVLNEKRIKLMVIPSRKTLNYLAVIVSALVLITFIDIIPNMFIGIRTLLSSSDNIHDLYTISTETRKLTKSFDGAFNFISIFANLAYGISPVIFFVYIIQRNPNKFILLLISLSMFRGPLHGIATASRSELISSFIDLIILYFLFSPFIEQQIKKKLIKYSTIIFSSLVSILLIITIARVTFTGKTDVVFNIVRYSSESPLVFNNYCFDANGTRDGNITIPLYNQMIGKNVLSEYELRNKFYYMKMDNSRFYTYVGDFVLDFGVDLTFILFLIFSIIFSITLKNKGKLSFYQILLAYLVMRFCTGFFQYKFNSIGGNLLFVFIICLSFFFYLVHFKKTKFNQIVYRNS